MTAKAQGFHVPNHAHISMKLEAMIVRKPDRPQATHNRKSTELPCPQSCTRQHETRSNDHQSLHILHFTIILTYHITTNIASITEHTKAIAAFIIPHYTLNHTHTSIEVYTSYNLKRYTYISLRWLYEVFTTIIHYDFLAWYLSISSMFPLVLRNFNMRT